SRRWRVSGRASAPRCHDGPSMITPRRRRDGDDAAGTVGRAGTMRNGPAARTGTAGTPPGTVPGMVPGRLGRLPSRVGTAGTVAGTTRPRGGPGPSRVGTARTAAGPVGDGRGRRDRDGPGPSLPAYLPSGRVRRTPG